MKQIAVEIENKEGNVALLVFPEPTDAEEQKITSALKQNYRKFKVIGAYDSVTLYTSSEMLETLIR